MKVPGKNLNVTVLSKYIMEDNTIASIMNTMNTMKIQSSLSQKTPSITNNIKGRRKKYFIYEKVSRSI